MNNIFYEQTKTCPICKETFKVTRVKSSNCCVIKRESDFNVIYRDINPIHYSIWVCPHCQFAVPDNHFSDKLRPAELEILKKGLALLKSEEPDFSGERTPKSALRAYELAIRSAQIKHADSSLKAGLFLRAAWICRELDNKELENEYLTQALNFYKESFEKEVNVSSKLSDTRLMYIIGELNRRLENYDIAVQWFSRAVMNPKIKEEKDLERLLRDQWDLARQQNKKVPHVGSADSSQSKDDTKIATPPKPESIGRYRNKVKMYTGIYNDQVEWLQSISNICHERTKELLEKETVLRALLDAVIEVNPQIQGCDTEENLRQQFIAAFKNIDKA